MNLIIDIGNSLTKVALFHQREPERVAITKELTSAWLADFVGADRPAHAMVAVTGAWPEFLGEWLDSQLQWEELTHQTLLPFKSLYQTPETLGRDRIAGLAGAWALGISKPLLVIDAGTCITMDLLDVEGVYRGGSISPGITMRLQAMHDYTHRLPAIELDPDASWPGTDTRTSLLAGSLWGAVLEIQGACRRYEKVHGKLNLVLTGGDADILAGKFKTMIFAHRDLVLIGLNYLLNYSLHAR